MLLSIKNALFRCGTEKNVVPLQLLIFCLIMGKTNQ